MRRFLVMLAVVGGVAGCGGESDPFADLADGGPGAPDGGGGPGTPDGGGPGPTADAGPPRACAPVPKRVIVLGDSITACNVVGGKMSADCVSKKLFDYVKGSYAPDAVYENYAVGGATMSGLAAQIDQIPSGPGHALVVVYIGGNDLSPYIFMSDAAAMGAYDGIAQRTVDTWANLFNELADTQRFPDGATVLMNNQYNPFDDCTASPYNLSAVKINILHMYNAILQDIANEAFEKALIVDQFTPYLGHGHHYDVQTCPHYTPGATPFMKDLIHANPAGNEALAKVLSAGADVLYRDCL